MPKPPQRPLDLAQLDAVTGGERISGTDGNDTIQAGGGDDHVSGGGGRDSIDGGDGDDIVIGGDGADKVSGGAGADVIIGGLGDDLLTGDAASDVMVRGWGVTGTPVGAQGDDEFRWHPGDGNDTIFGGGTGFGNGTDVLVIEDSGLSLQGLFDGLQLDSGRMPRMMDGYIDVTGFNGTLTIGGETIRFTGLEKLVLGSYTFIPGR